MLALARKYRPRSFAAVAVQTHVANTLRSAIERGRVAHGYLFCGPRGTGKTTLARVLAMALNCPNRVEGEPCGTCESCTRIWSGASSLDVIEIDAASNRGVDDARDLRERAMYAPSSDQRYKVYIVDEAHMLTREAWNALLKILEEPPPRVVFAFATTEPQKIAQTAQPVLSRLQRFDLKRIGPGEVKDRLAAVLRDEGVEADADGLAMLARAADGSLRDALSLTDQVLALGDGAVTAERVREALGLVAEDEYLAVLDLVADRRAGDVFPLVARLADAGIDFGQFLAGLADMLRAQLAVTLGGAPTDVSERARGELAARRDRLSQGDLLRMLQALLELEPRFRKSGQQRALLETLLVRFALMDRSVALDDVLRALGGGSGGGGAPDDDRPAMRRAAPVDAHDATRRAAPADREVPRAAPVVADRPAPARDAGAPPSTAQLAERWTEITDRLRRDRRAALAGIADHAVPIAASSAGLLTLEVADDTARSALEVGADALLAAAREVWPGVSRLAVRVLDEGQGPRRMTHEAVRADRVARLRRADSALGAAIDALDLELLD
jgi:DNA polymerase-3 subunit gamma/tau